jgi:NADPH:quinone reductase-like Zn-dependent oxidoreductase
MPAFAGMTVGETGIMKAIVIHRFGPPEVLSYEDLPDPAPRAGEIRIRVHAATVNRVLDVRLRAGTEFTVARRCRSFPASIAPAWSTRSARA